jgi:Ran GTPase-activating protein (RanGAP) involved in mRNA processing and transport
MNLTAIDLSHNKFTGALPTMSGCVSLVKLSLFNNNFSGRIPTTSTTASGIGVAFSCCPKLEEIDLSCNRCSGPIPSFENCPKLRYLDLSDNEFSGSIPANQGDTQPHANRTGEEPRCLSLTLEQLYLDGNDLTGAIPDFASLGYTSLHTLSIEANFLAGVIPSMQSCKDLAILNLQVNRFSAPQKWKDNTGNYPPGCAVSV